MEADVALLDAVRRMDGEALVQVFDMYSPALFHYVMRSCYDPLMADQIVGDVFARLLEQLSSGNGPITNLRSYLFESTYHLIVDNARYGQRRVPLDVVDSLPADRQTFQLDLENRILWEKVFQVIQKELTDYQRHVIILRFMEGFSLSETADILGKTVNIVKAAQNRAMANLRKCLCQEQWLEAFTTGGEHIQRSYGM